MSLIRCCTTSPEERLSLPGPPDGRTHVPEGYEYAECASFFSWGCAAPPPEVWTTPVRCTLTPREGEALELVRALTREKGWPPTLRELGIHLHVSRTTAQYLLESLEAKGAIMRDGGAGQARGVRVVGEVTEGAKEIERGRLREALTALPTVDVATARGSLPHVARVDVMGLLLGEGEGDGGER